MRRAVVLCTVLLMMVAGSAVAELSQEKLNELNAAGITDWTPGQNRGSGPVFGTLANPINVGVPNGEDTATNVYDDGVVNALPTVFGQIYGNKFSLGVSGVPLSTITLNSFSFYFAEDSVGDTGLIFQPGAPGATSNMIVPRASINVGGLVNAGSSFSMLTTINVIPQTALGTTGMFSNTFYLGAWCLNANSSVPVDNEALGLATNGPRQQGYTATSGAGPTSVASAPGAFNAILRTNITSPNAVPVELMAFEVEE